MDENVVHIRDLRFQWQEQSSPVLDIADLLVGKGERVFIKGPSGSGKTTLLNLLAGVLTPSSGKVEVLQTDLGCLGGAERDTFRADHIGFVFQMFNLVPYLNLLENVILPCTFSDTRKTRATQREATLVDEARRLLSHLKLDPADFTSRSVSRLSVGQQQRVAVARALIGRPELIICDEPTSSLDADARQSFIDLLFQEAAEAGATLIFVSHDSSLANSFDRTIHLPSVNRGTT